MGNQSEETPPEATLAALDEAIASLERDQEQPTCDI